MSLQKRLSTGEFVVLAEMNTPKGVDTSQLASHARLLKGRVHAVTIPDMDNGIMRMSALAGGVFFNQQGIESIIHVYCRDRNHMALQGDVLAAYGLGIRNLMVVASEDMANCDHDGEAGRFKAILTTQPRYIRTGSFDPVATSKPGIYVCGLFESPKDIPDTMIQASAAAANAAPDLTPLRVVAEAKDDLPPEREVAGEEPRVGVFVCDCGHDIGGVVDVEAMTRSMAKLPQVVVAETIGHGCSRESLERIQAAIRSKNLNRVVVGACSPRTHEGLFQETVRKCQVGRFDSGGP